MASTKSKTMRFSRTPSSIGKASFEGICLFVLLCRLGRCVVAAQTLRVQAESLPQAHALALCAQDRRRCSQERLPVRRCARVAAAAAAAAADVSLSGRYDPVLNLEKSRESYAADELTPEQHAEVTRASVVCVWPEAVPLCCAMQALRKHLTARLALQFDLWDDAPTLDEEEEAFEVDGIRRGSIAAMPTVSEGSDEAAAGGGA